MRYAIAILAAAWTAGMLPAAAQDAYPSKPIRLNAAAASLARPETQQRLKTFGAITVGGSPADFVAFLEKDAEKWARVIKAAGVKGE